MNITNAARVPSPQKNRRFFAGRLTQGEKIFTVFNYAILGLLGLVTFFPFYVVLTKSFSPPVDYLNKVIIWWPSEFVFDYYRFVLGAGSEFMRALKNTLFYVTVGTAVNITVTFIVAFVLAQRRLPFRNQITFFMVFTMFFGGGMIPGFLIMRMLGLLNKPWGIVINQLFSTMYALYLRNFIMTIPTDLIESAQIDGCPEFKLLTHIILPLSLPSLATFTLFYAVQQWNLFQPAVLYLTDAKKLPLQVYIYQMISAMTIAGDADELRRIYESGYRPPADALKAAAVICSTVPIVVVYPFLQKYFVKGMMMGSLKG
ncbi:ABC transporter permease [Clostridia bacterium]|nr:ABC transporter permease [Clostridia bacterium]